MTTRKPFLLRLDPEVHRALETWAADELRSVNGQIEFLLRRALEGAGRKARSRRGTTAAKTVRQDSPDQEAGQS